MMAAAAVAVLLPVLRAALLLLCAAACYYTSYVVRRTAAAERERYTRRTGTACTLHTGGALKRGCVPKRYKDTLSYPSYLCPSC